MHFWSKWLSYIHTISRTMNIICLLIKNSSWFWHDKTRPKQVYCKESTYMYINKLRVEMQTPICYQVLRIHSGDGTLLGSLPIVQWTCLHFRLVLMDWQVLFAKSCQMWHLVATIISLIVDAQTMTYVIDGITLQGMLTPYEKYHFKSYSCHFYRNYTLLIRRKFFAKLL